MVSATSPIFILFLRKNTVVYLGQIRLVKRRPAMHKKTRKLLRQSFRISGATRIFAIYAVFFIIIAVLLYVIEPGIPTVWEGLWYCFETATTIGFGEITVLSPVARILTVILSLYSVAVVAVFTAVITSFFLDIAKARMNDSIKEFLDDLEHLPDLSKEELRALSEKVKKYHGSD